MIRRRVVILLAASLWGSAPSVATAQERPADRVPLTVTGKWLAAHLDEPHQVIVHAAASRAEYEAGHVAGARLLLFASYAPSLGGLSSQMPPVATLDSVMESVGINDGDRVIIYGQPLQMARLLVTLDYLGLKGRVSVLDGGMDAWRDEGRAVSRDTVAITPGHFTPKVDPSVIAGIDWVSANTATPGISILDARAPEFYLGYSPGQMPRAGHIPGAKNVPFSQLTGELTTIRSDDKLRHAFAAAGVPAGDTVVTYCHIGMQASLLYYAARRLGYNARIFDGSFEEWSKKSELPVVVEAERKE